MPAGPYIENAPGLVWKKRRNGKLEARWQARSDLIKKGWPHKSQLLWSGHLTDTSPDEFERGYIADRCRSLQEQMLYFAHDDVPQVRVIDGSVGALCRIYMTDKDSPVHKKRYATKRHYANVCKAVTRDIGDMMLAEMKARDVLRWHEEYLDAGKVTMGHTVVGFLRMAVNFGAAFHEDEQCIRLSGILSKMTFQNARPRHSILTAEHAQKIIDAALATDRPSMAVAQAFQFDGMFRQKDAIGEWVPMSEPGMSDVLHHGRKWLRGLRWEEIDQNLRLRHVTSKRQKEVVIDLHLAPMVLSVLTRLYPSLALANGGYDRAALPARGPVVVNEQIGRPYDPTSFRQAWRALADGVGVPKSVRNMDSRAGAITEATEAGAQLEHIKHAATHSDIAMTQRYARAGEEKTALVMQQRVAHRQGKTGKTD